MTVAAEQAAAGAVASQALRHAAEPRRYMEAVAALHRLPLDEWKDC